METVNVANPVLVAAIKLAAVLADNYQKSFPESKPLVFTVEEARKYIKIWKEVPNNRSIHAFIDKEGNVYKPASYKAPAKGIRYNLLTDPESCYQRADWAGGYLYR